MPKKELIVVAGPNGAGKSTFISGCLSERACPYLCADLIATEFQHLDPVSQQLAAGREFLPRLDRQLNNDEDFMIETTMSGRTLRSYLTRARMAGFVVSIFFIYLDSADSCVARVRERVRRGGHHVPEVDVRRRFARSLVNFWMTYRGIVDYWALFYNVGTGYQDVAFGVADEFLVSDELSFRRFLDMAEVDKNG